MSDFEDNHGRDITVGAYVWHDDAGTVLQVCELDDGTGHVMDENDEDWKPDDLEVLVPFPAEDPSWFYATGSQRWIAPVGDGSVHVELYADELAALDAARAQLADGAR
jgi:hypothetical protein